jgi:hypothetical protein
MTFGDKYKDVVARDLLPFRFRFTYPTELVAKLLGVRTSTVKRWMNSGVLSSVPGDRTTSGLPEVVHVSLVEMVSFVDPLMPAEGALRRAEWDAARAGVFPPIPWDPELIARAMGLPPEAPALWVAMGFKPEPDGRINPRKLERFAEKTPSLAAIVELALAVGDLATLSNFPRGRTNA